MLCELRVGWVVIDGAFCIFLLPEDLINSGKLPRHQSVYLFTTLKVIYLMLENRDRSCEDPRFRTHTDAGSVTN